MKQPATSPAERQSASITLLLQGLTDKGNIYGRLNAFGATISTEDGRSAQQALPTNNE